MTVEIKTDATPTNLEEAIAIRSRCLGMIVLLDHLDTYLQDYIAGDFSKNPSKTLALTDSSPVPVEVFDEFMDEMAQWHDELQERIKEINKMKVGVPSDFLDEYEEDEHVE